MLKVVMVLISPDSVLTATTNPRDPPTPGPSRPPSFKTETDVKASFGKVEQGPLNNADEALRSDNSQPPTAVPCHTSDHAEYAVPHHRLI